MAEPTVIAVLGAESTGKTTLAEALAGRLRDETGLRVTWVPEWLREWCAREGRTPRRDEQAAIANEQHRRIDVAAEGHDVVLCDTTALMTAVYSRHVFGDASLDRAAVELHRRRVALSLLTALDLPWVADGLQRDGEHVREPVDAALRALLQAHGLPFVPVGGLGAARLEAAVDAVAPLLRRIDAPRRGLFTRLEQREAEAAAWTWVCEWCDVPDCEHALRAGAASRASGERGPG
jgi:nicotinamide riboside kinase